jgi:hypothetical protein
MNEAKERIGPPIREVVTRAQYLTKPACLLLLALTGHPLLEMEDATAQEPTVPSNESSQPNGVKGTVSQYLMNPDGVMDGLLLSNNTLVRFPPHLSYVLAQTVSLGDVVRIEGFFDAPGTIHASAIADLSSQRSVVDAPPAPRHFRPPSPDNKTREQMSVSGAVRVLTHSPQGEIDGAVLTDGSIIHFSPSLGSQFPALMREGQTIAASGFGTKNEFGQSLEATSIGSSLDQLQTVTRPDSKSGSSEAPRPTRPR